tara:strand:+ start:23923 stop:24819 length:897 start_codon:yes stop_codon:yes gene_type:complete
MARIIDAFTQFPTLPYGRLYFTGVGALATTDKATFATSVETSGTENTNPLILDGEGWVPNCFGTGSYTIRLADKNDSTIDTFTPVGGTDTLAAFGDWSSLVNYQISSPPVTGSDSFYYKSITDDNLDNDPVSDGGVNWERVRFISDYTAVISYVIGDIVNISDGTLWASQTTSNLANPPSADDGTNWLPAVAGAKIPEIIALNTWINKSSSFTITAGESYQIDASGGAINAAMPASLVVGQVITAHNESISTSTVLITNPAFTIKGPGGTIAAGTDLELAAGDTAKLVAKTTLILEVV